MIFGGTHRQVRKADGDEKSAAGRFEKMQTEDSEYLPRMLGVLMAGGVVSFPLNGGSNLGPDTTHFFMSPYRGD